MTKIQRELLEILKRLGGSATTRQISEASGRDHLDLGPRINTNSVSQSLSYLDGRYVKYEGMASKGNARWRLIKEPEPLPKKQPDAQSRLDF